eukprot:7722527-Alexandrium_andersonii.AAC.1
MWSWGNVGVECKFARWASRHGAHLCGTSCATVAGKACANADGVVALICTSGVVVQFLCWASYHSTPSRRILRTCCGEGLRERGWSRCVGMDVGRCSIVVLVVVVELAVSELYRGTAQPAHVH